MDRVFSSSSAFVLLGLSATDLRTALIFVLCLVVATAFHEFAHAIVADRLGDPTPGREGRVTLNPLVHADPIGTLALPVMAGLLHLPVFGWGRPVMTQPRYYTRRFSMRAGMAMVSYAGPLANVLQAAVTLGVIKVLLLSGVTHPGLLEVLATFFLLNVTLAFFNLLPIHPLDGGKILAWMMPARFDHIDDILARYGWTILLALMLIPGLLQTLFMPVRLVVDWGMRLVGL
ncbi:MAG: site-2 protease family protein [Nannocystis sp.]|nr:site-2 protease family protein [Nannocystis sp.]MBA3547098.1 site-2 protease family protein [Nannocystis sp.]